MHQLLKAKRQSGHLEKNTLFSNFRAVLDLVDCSGSAPHQTRLDDCSPSPPQEIALLEQVLNYVELLEKEGQAKNDRLNNLQNQVEELNFELETRCRAEDENLSAAPAVTRNEETEFVIEELNGLKVSLQKAQTERAEAERAARCRERNLESQIAELNFEMKTLESSFQQARRDQFNAEKEARVKRAELQILHEIQEEKIAANFELDKLKAQLQKIECDQRNCGYGTRDEFILVHLEG
ncbi:hypothetical protein CYMTET_12672 [Cymbomonas tetramitiformis]|uniref:Uncharacterized protein n=1 Tax=Cymbomonas tetramitiformis TaxID=36881 RepID=A0AAE0GJZ4_9CHLO|nr:hypothetical protein CYMTET_12672 [Cymbomonas tetramitiformis]